MSTAKYETGYCQKNKNADIIRDIYKYCTQSIIMIVDEDLQFRGTKRCYAGNNG